MSHFIWAEDRFMLGKVKTYYIDCRALIFMVNFLCLSTKMPTVGQNQYCIGIRP